MVSTTMYPNFSVKVNSHGMFSIYEGRLEST